MQYAVIVRDKEKGGGKWLHDSFLDGIVPDHVIAMMKTDFVERELGLCGNVECQQAFHCHVLVRIPDPFVSCCYEKLCPVLFHDAFKPDGWKVEDLL